MKKIHFLFLFLFFVSLPTLSFADLSTEIDDLFGSLTGDEKKVMRVAEVRRNYIVHLPPVMKKKLPLVLFLHPNGQTAKSFMRMTKLNELADMVGFVVLYPQGLENHRRQGDYQWDVDPDMRRRGDKEFLLNIVQEAIELYDIDAEKIFIVGYRGGGEMAFRMVCESPRLFSGLAVGDARLPQYLTESCDALNSIPVLFFYHGGRISDSEMESLSLEKTFLFWQRKNQCLGEISDEPLKDTDLGDRIRIYQRDIKGCAGGAFKMTQLRFEGEFEGWPNAGTQLSPGLTAGFELAPFIWSYLDQASSVSFTFPESEESL